LQGAFPQNPKKRKSGSKVDEIWRIRVGLCFFVQNRPKSKGSKKAKKSKTRKNRKKRKKTKNVLHEGKSVVCAD
jgi:hypothetical protein